MVGAHLLDDPAEIFQLPQIREMLEGLGDCFAALFTTLVLRNPQEYFKWKPQPHEVERAAKPVSVMLARRPQIQNVVKKWAAPGMLGGAIAAYVAPRVMGLRVTAPPRPTQEPPASTVQHTGPAPAATSTVAAAATPEQREKIDPVKAAELNTALTNIIAQARSSMPQ